MSSVPIHFFFAGKMEFKDGSFKLFFYGGGNLETLSSQ
jgi:hypothetical protein